MLLFLHFSAGVLFMNRKAPLTCYLVAQYNSLCRKGKINDSFSSFTGLWCNQLVHEHFPTVLNRFFLFLFSYVLVTVQESNSEFTDKGRIPLQGRWLVVEQSSVPETVLCTSHEHTAAVLSLRVGKGLCSWSGAEFWRLNSSVFPLEEWLSSSQRE